MAAADRTSATITARASHAAGAAAQPGRKRRHSSVAKQVAFSAAIVVMLLFAAEAAVRAWALFFRTSYERYNPRTGRLELVPNIRYTNARGEEFWINSKGFVGPEFDDEPAPGVYRIIALGDSCTFATGFWQIGYPSILQRRLNGGTSTGRFEVINAGIEGYNSAFALERIRDELLRYRPRLVIVYIGWNDLMKTDPARESHVDRYRGLAAGLERSYLVKAYTKLLFVHLRPLVFRPRTGDDPDDARAFDDFVPARYRANLTEIARTLRAHDITPLFVTLPTVVRSGMTQDDLRRASVFFPYFSEAYGVARLLSLHRAYNRTILDVAREQHIDVVDLQQVFEPLGDRTGYFWDTMHPNGRGGAVIAQALAERITSLGHWR